MRAATSRGRASAPLRAALAALLAIALSCSPCLPAAALADEAAGGADAACDAGEESDEASEQEAAAALAQGVEGMPSTEESSAEEDDADDSDEELVSTFSLSELYSSTGRTIKLASIAGDNRYKTAVAAAQAAFPDGVDSGHAIVVNGSGAAWADSLAATSLAGMLECPILYTKAKSLPSCTAEALSDLGVEAVIVVGGTSRVSASVYNKLETLCGNATRLAGATRYDTQLAVYDYGVQVGVWSGTVLVASGASWADALSVSPVAYGQLMPVFLAPASGSLTDEQLDALEGGGAERFVVLGGTSAVASSVKSQLLDVVKTLYGSRDGSRVERISGANRYTTSWNIAKWAVSSGYLKWNYTGFASGASSADALSGSVLQGVTGSPLLLINNDKLYGLNKLASYSPSRTRVFGGTSVITPTTRNEIAMTLGYKLTQIEGFKIYVDAGHGQNNTGNGAYDSGATGNGYKEAVLTAELAGLVADALVDDGYEVFLNDDGGPYKYRHAEAVAQGCNVIISIHFNAAGGSGSMTLIHNSNACEYSEYVADIMQDYLVAGMGLADLGVREQAVSILSGQLPAALLEVCFIDRYSDISKYVKRKSTVAAKIVEGIESL